MQDGRQFEREVRAAWDDVRKERRERRRQISAAELTSAAERLREIAATFDALSATASQSEAAAEPANDKGVPSAPKPVSKPKAKGKSKAKKATAAKSAKKTKRK